MKKALAIILAAAFLLSLSIIPVGAAPAKTYDILRAATPPTIDGVVNADEWQGALVGHVDNTDPNYWGDATDPVQADYYLMWDDSGLYFAAVAANDPDGFTAVPAGQEYTKMGDGVQLVVDPSDRSADNLTSSNTAYIFDVYPQSNWYEHWIYPAADGDDVLAGRSDIVTKGWVGSDGKSWSVEAFFPWTELQKGGAFPVDQFTVAPGMKMVVGYLLMEVNNGNQSGWSSADTWNTDDFDTGVLSATTGGIQPVAATTTVQADTGAAAAPAADTAQTPPSPQTGDAGMWVWIMAGVLAIGAGTFTAVRKFSVKR